MCACACGGGGGGASPVKEITKAPILFQFWMAALGNPLPLQFLGLCNPEHSVPSFFLFDHLNPLHQPRPRPNKSQEGAVFWVPGNRDFLRRRTKAGGRLELAGRATFGAGEVTSLARAIAVRTHLFREGSRVPLLALPPPRTILKSLRTVPYLAAPLRTRFGVPRMSSVCAPEAAYQLERGRPCRSPVLPGRRASEGAGRQLSNSRCIPGLDSSAFEEAPGEPQVLGTLDPVPSQGMVPSSSSHFRPLQCGVKGKAQGQRRLMADCARCPHFLRPPRPAGLPITANARILIPGCSPV